MVQAVTLDFYGTLVFHRDGRGRGRALVEYLTGQGYEPAPWEHDILYEVFASHAADYRPDAPADERHGYYARLASLVFRRMGIDASGREIARQADAIWRILGPGAFELFPEVPGALRALGRLGMTLGVVSNWHRGLRHFCAELGLTGFLGPIVGSADVGVAKPDAGIFRRARDLLGTSTDAILHAGDSLVDDYAGARAAGLQVVLVHRAGDAAPTGVRAIPSLAELPDLVERSRHPTR